MYGTSLRPRKLSRQFDVLWSSDPSEKLRSTEDAQMASAQTIEPAPESSSASPIFETGGLLLAIDDKDDRDSSRPTPKGRNEGSSESPVSTSPPSDGPNPSRLLCSRRLWRPASPPPGGERTWTPVKSASPPPSSSETLRPEDAASPALRRNLPAKPEEFSGERPVVLQDPPNEERSVQSPVQLSAALRDLRVSNKDALELLIFIDHENAQDASAALLEAPSFLHFARALVFYHEDPPNEERFQRLARGEERPDVVPVRAPRRKNGADFELAVRAARLHEQLPASTRFLIVSADQGVREIADALGRASSSSAGLRPQRDVRCASTDPDGLWRTAFELLSDTARAAVRAEALEALAERAAAQLRQFRPRTEFAASNFLWDDVLRPEEALLFWKDADWPFLVAGIARRGVVLQGSSVFDAYSDALRREEREGAASPSLSDGDLASASVAAGQPVMLQAALRDLRVRNQDTLELVVFIDHENDQNAITSLLEAPSFLFFARVLVFYHEDPPNEEQFQRLARGEERPDVVLLRVPRRSPAATGFEPDVHVRAAVLHALLPARTRFLIVSADQGVRGVADALARASASSAGSRAQRSISAVSTAANPDGLWRGFFDLLSDTARGAVFAEALEALAERAAAQLRQLRPRTDFAARRLLEDEVLGSEETWLFWEDGECPLLVTALATRGVLLQGDSLLFI
eukprot:tig00020510_g9937.t1